MSLFKYVFTPENAMIQTTIGKRRLVMLVTQNLSLEGFQSQVDYWQVLSTYNQNMKRFLCLLDFIKACRFQKPFMFIRKQNRTYCIMRQRCTVFVIFSVGFCIVVTYNVNCTLFIILMHVLYESKETVLKL